MRAWVFKIAALLCLGPFILAQNDYPSSPENSPDITIPSEKEVSETVGSLPTEPVVPQGPETKPIGVQTDSKNRYQKDEISFEYKGGLDYERMSEEDDKLMMEFMTAWSDHVSMISGPVFNFEIAAGGTFRFYQNVTQVPQKINGVYSVPETGAKSITLTVMDPNGGAMLVRMGARDLLFYPVAKIPGRYVIEITNNNVTFSSTP